MAPPKGKAKRASVATPLVLYRRALTAIKGWSPTNNTAADAEAVSALTACCAALQAKLGLAAATATPDAGATAAAANGDSNSSGAAAAGLEPALAGLEGLEKGMASYGACVKHNLDLDLEDWEDEPGFLLACAHLELGRLLGRTCPPRSAAELAHLTAAVALFPGFVAGRHALAQALLARGDAQSDLDAAEQLLRGCLATCRRLSAATGEAGEAEMEEEEEGAGRGEGGGEGSGDGQGEGQGEAGEEGGEEEGQGGLLLEANAACRREWEAAAGVRRSLAMLLCQAGRDREAAPVLRALDFTHRLARPVLHYPLDPLLSTASPSTSSAAPAAAASGPGPHGHERYCAAVDGALPPALLGVLRAALAPGSRYWAQHGYGRVGYFSYMHELGSPHLSAVHDAAVLLHRRAAARFPAVREAKYAEWWAHCRRHPSGHQLHFDSDDEGAGGVRNPVVSSVIYLTGEVGGPTLVTPQTLGGPLADRGWLIHPRQNRLAMFDGSFLHGVIPGRGASPHPAQHRITLMVAFWRDIQCRPRTDGLPGPSQPFPGSAPATCDAAAASATAASAIAASGTAASGTAASGATAVGGADGTAGRYTWMSDLPPHPEGPDGWGSTNPVDALPTPIPRVWECVDGGEAQPGAVQYDACFQGF